MTNAKKIRNAVLHEKRVFGAVSLVIETSELMKAGRHESNVHCSILT